MTIAGSSGPPSGDCQSGGSIDLSSALAPALRDAKSHLVVSDLDNPALDDDDLHHLGRVLRLGDGAPVTVTDGHGRWRPTIWRSGAVEPTGAVVSSERTTAPVTIGVAIPKQDRPEWIVQKCTELGVATIVFLETEHSVVRWNGERAAKKLDKLRRTAREALRQSRGVWLSNVEGPVPAADLLSGAWIAEPGAEPLGRVVREALPDPAIFLIGPEGGWSDLEVNSAAGRFGLGNSVLRVETAALVVAAMTVGR